LHYGYPQKLVYPHILAKIELSKWISHKKIDIEPAKRLKTQKWGKVFLRLLKAFEVFMAFIE